MMSHTRFSTAGRGLAAPRSAALLLALALAGALMCAVRGQDVAAAASGQAVEEAAGKVLNHLRCPAIIYSSSTPAGFPVTDSGFQ
jgi:hypothetical protein